MLNLLVADDNFDYAKNLVNFILSRDNKIRLVNISTDGNEAINNIRKNSIDILILDLKMPVLSGMDVLHQLKNEVLYKKPLIIVISGENNMITKIRDDTIVTCYINKSQGLEYIYDRIETIIKENNLIRNKKRIRQDILEELLCLGYNIKHRGTRYLLEAIEIACQFKEEQLVNNIEKDLYSKIANRHSKSIQNVKSNIMKATDCMYVECDKNRINEYFNFLNNYKPTPKLVISTIVSKIII